MNNNSTELEKFFQRQMQIRKFDQEKLNINVLIAGLGGTGTHIALACVRLGIKELTIVDYETIEPSNLNRQVLYRKTDIGLSKTKISDSCLIDNNLVSNIHSHETNIFSNWQKFLQLVKNSNFVFCCLDLPIIKRLAVASACLFYEKPMIYAGIDVVNANSGMILFQSPKGNPCYECLESCLSQIAEKYHDLFIPDNINKLERINLKEIQKNPNIIASSNYYIATLISNLAINLMIQYIQDWIEVPHRIIFDALNWSLQKFHLERSSFCKLC